MELVSTTGLIVRHEGTDGSFSELNLDHWLDVAQKLKFKRNKSSSEVADHSHYTLNSMLLNKKQDQVYVITEVKKKWFAGYYYSAVLVSGDCRCSVILENISSVMPDIIRGAENFANNYRMYFKSLN